MDLHDVMTAFLEAKANTLAYNTIKNYTTSFNRLLETTGNIPAAELHPTHIDQLVAKHRTTGNSVATINLNVSHIRVLCRWAKARGYMPATVDPTLDWDGLTDHKKPRAWLPMSTFPVLLDAAADPWERMLISLGLYTMLRSSEMRSITLGDVDLESGVLHVQIFKTKDSDSMPICSELDAELRSYLIWLQEQVDYPLTDGCYLIPGKTPYAFQKLRVDPMIPLAKPEDILRRVLRNAGIEVPKGNGLHLLRRSAARALFSELCDRGYDGALRQVQTWLHHKNSTMTEHYLGLTLDREQRDKQTIGQSLFPSLQADNILPLAARREAVIG